MEATFKNGTYTGDILHCYSEKNDVVISLENATLTGAITTAVSSHPNGLPKCKEQYGLIGRVETFPCPKDTEFGVKVTVGENSVWTVAHTSYLSQLTIRETGKVSGLMTVDGKPTELLPGSYTGKIVLNPAK